MVIFVPPGSTEDATRPPEYYNETYAYIAVTGLLTL